MADIYVTVGLPGSGKSTWARANAERLQAVVVNRDALRQMIFGGPYVFDTLYEPLVKDMAISACRCALCSDYGVTWNVILDETGINRKNRAFWVRLFKAEGHRVVFVHFPEQQHNLEYRMKDGRGHDLEYWGRVISQLQQVYEPPALDEGCDEIIEGSL